MKRSDRHWIQWIGSKWSDDVTYKPLISWRNIRSLSFPCHKQSTHSLFIAWVIYSLCYQLLFRAERLLPLPCRSSSGDQQTSKGTPLSPCRQLLEDKRKEISVIHTPLLWSPLLCPAVLRTWNFRLYTLYSVSTLLSLFFREEDQLLASINLKQNDKSVIAIDRRTLAATTTTTAIAATCYYYTIKANPTTTTSEQWKAISNLVDSCLKKNMAATRL